MTRGRKFDPFYTAPWEQRFDELRRKKLTYNECAAILNQEGFKSATGRSITIDQIRCRVFNRKKEQKP